MAVLESIAGILGGIAQLHPVFVLLIFILFVAVAYKVFKALIKALMIGVIAAIFPFFANYIGISVPTDISTIVWFGTFGVLFFLVYNVVHSVLKAGSSILGGGEKGRIRSEVRKEMEKQKGKKKSG